MFYDLGRILELLVDDVIHPLDVVSVGDVVDVKVVEVDLKKKRIGLSMVL